MSTAWVKAEDPTSGDVYYANTETQETSWTVPDGFYEGDGGAILPIADATIDKDEKAVKEPKIEVVPAATAPSPIASDEKPGYWKETADNVSDPPRVFYYHTKTRERTWDKPDDYDELLKAYQDWKVAKKKKKKVSTPAPEPTSHSFPADDPLMEMGMAGPGDFSMMSPNISWDEDNAAHDSESDKEIVEEEDWAGAGDLDVIIVEDDNKDDTSLQFGDYSLEKYAEKYFNQHKNGIFSKASIQQMLSYTPELIKAPILKKLNPNSQLVSDACQIFRNITGYMGDRKTGKGTGGHIQKICKIAIQSPEEMRDEIYCQICRQTNGNDRRESCISGWRLMSICCSIFPPSEEFSCYLQSYISQGIDLNNESSPYALFAQQRLISTLATGSRATSPGSAEIDAIEQRRPVAIRVLLMDDSYKTLSIQSQTTARKICDILSIRLKINNAESFSLFQMVDGPKGPIREKLISPDERILDVLSVWDEISKRYPDHVFKLVYRLQLILSHEEELLSDESLHMLFIQAVRNVIVGNCPVSETLAMELAALQTQAAYGHKDSSLYRPGLLVQKLKEFIPKQFYEKRDHSYLEAKILQEHTKFIHLTKIEAEREYLKLAKDSPSYGCQFFREVKQVTAISKGPPDPCIIGISEKGIYIIDPKTMAIRTHWMFQEVVGYGFREASFMAIVGNNVKKNKYSFQTVEGKAMKELIATYIAKLVDAQRRR